MGTFRGAFGKIDFQQCGILTSVDSDKPVQPLFKMKTQNDVQ